MTIDLESMLTSIAEDSAKTRAVNVHTGITRLPRFGDGSSKKFIDPVESSGTDGRFLTVCADATGNGVPVTHQEDYRNRTIQIYSGMRHLKDIKIADLVKSKETAVLKKVGESIVKSTRSDEENSVLSRKLNGMAVGWLEAVASGDTVDTVKEASVQNHKEEVSMGDRPSLMRMFQKDPPSRTPQQSSPSNRSSIHLEVTGVPPVVCTVSGIYASSNCVAIETDDPSTAKIFEQIFNDDPEFESPSFLICRLDSNGQAFGSVLLCARTELSFRSRGSSYFIAGIVKQEEITS